MNVDLDRFLAAIWDPGDVREVRAPKYGRNGTMSGYFDSPQELAAALAQHDGKVNLYITANPVDHALLARANNRLEKRALKAAADMNIVARRWLPIDIDPRRPAGISSTEEEREDALELARAVVADLSARGWPQPVVAMSGNGYLVLYRIDLPNDAPSLALVNGVLQALGKAHDNERVHVDTTMGNAARIVALVGTMKVKGDSLPDRPHRRSAIVKLPDQVETVATALLEALSPPQTAQEPRVGDWGGGMPPGWVLELLDANGIAYREPDEPDANGIVWIGLEACPFHDDGQEGRCGVGEAPDGRATGKCFHNRGAGKHWQDFKAALGLKFGPTLDFSGEDDDGEALSAADRSWEGLAGDALHGGRFAAAVKGKVLYDTTIRAWYVWDGHHWRRDGKQAVKRLYRKYLNARMADAMKIGDNASRSAAMQSVMSASRTDSRINGALSMASIDLSVEASVWDRDPWLLGVRNGVVDLRTGKLRDGRPEDFITKVARSDYVAGATAPRWERFLDEVFLGDSELIDWLQLFLGYGCIGLVEAEVWGLFHGGGSNGKSTLLKAVRNVLGTYATTTNPDAILTAQRNRGSGPDEEVAALRGARLVTGSESEHDIVLSSAKAKKLAAKDQLRASRKNEHDVVWEPSHLLILGLNQLPQLNDNSHGAWRRIALVPFMATFAEDNRLEGELEAEAAGILSWLVAGAVRYAKARSLDPKPAIVVKATADYRKSEDHVARFINECVTHSPGTSSKAGLTYKAYADWCSQIARLAHGAKWTSNVFGRDFAGKVSEVLGQTIAKGETRDGSFVYHDIVVTLPPMGPTINFGAYRAGAAGPGEGPENSPPGGDQGGVRESAGVQTQGFPEEIDLEKGRTMTPADSRRPASEHGTGSVEASAESRPAVPARGPHTSESLARLRDRVPKKRAEARMWAEIVAGVADWLALEKAGKDEGWLADEYDDVRRVHRYWDQGGHVDA